MRVKVCDALPGRGKTTACINMMNENTADRYIFVTQYLSEVDRIKTCCAGRNFISPERTPGVNNTKLDDMHELIQRGENIATTHALFLNYTEETKQMIRDYGYVLILDEVVDVFVESELCKGDVEILKRGGIIKESDEDLTVMEWGYEDYGQYSSGMFKDEMYRAKSKNFLKYGDDYFFWMIPPDLFDCFKDVYILTYMFYGQSLKYFFDVYGIKHELIDVKFENGMYRFCPVGESSRAVDLRDKIHIYDGGKVNEIGNPRTALSYTWYNKAMSEPGRPDITKLKNNLNQVFRNVWKSKSEDIIWTTFKSAEDAMRGKGYWNDHVSYNKRASNEYASRHYLAYCVNNFARPMENKYYASKGIRVNQDLYAISIMVQWVFRSAIRNGEDVWLYIPSLRMRTLLKEWLNRLAAGTDLTIDRVAIPDPEENKLKLTNKLNVRRLK